MKVEFKGLEKIIKDMATVTEVAIKSEMAKAVRVSTSECQQHAKSIVPVDTGDLKKSIGINIYHDGLIGEVEPTMDYRVYVEYGTRFMAAQPYMRPSFYKQEPIFKKDMEKIVKKYTKG
ncbi:HK97-gp10 family putative phage morphogenesis protein [Lagierella massiliensis]|uniref:HK97-gp10 family putative phage morphogenesis protein n=1 Tax=Lagierella massiliensis TaxID=1689303 RepID=UPI0006D7980B|nr:HK97-gp10 family putative phage morphogenesis protein [Lagierella massiliensis]